MTALQLLYIAERVLQQQTSSASLSAACISSVPCCQLQGFFNVLGGKGRWHAMSDLV